MREYEDEKEALSRMLELLRDGTAVLVAGQVGDLPTINHIGHREGQRLRCSGPVVHCGMGLFRAPTPSGDLYFDGGGAMRAVKVSVIGPEWGWSWCPLTVGTNATRQAYRDLGYDFDGAIAEVTTLLEKVEE